MKRRKKYDSPVVLQQAEVLLELAFLTPSTVDDGLRNGGVFSNYQENNNINGDSAFDVNWTDSMD